MRRHGTGRGVGSLLSDFGHTLPAAPTQAEPPPVTRLFHTASWRGRPVRGAGWTPASVPVSRWRMTSDQAPVLWPLVTGPGLPPTGAQMGIDYFSGGSFYADPHGWVLDETATYRRSFRHQHTF